MTQEELERVSVAHALWLSSDGKEGIRADLSIADLTGLDFSRLRGADGAADLSRAILRGANLKGADLSYAKLRGADLSDADLSGATLASADLTDADLEGATLQGAVFLAARLAGANLHGALLQKADLEHARESFNGQFAGSDLTNAKVPPSLQTFDALPRIEELSKMSITLFVVMILGCVYAWLTIGSTSDARLLSNSVSSPLPIIQTAVPIASFFLIAPIILLSLYIYLHLYLQKLWKALAGLPAVFPDGKPVYEKVYPWLLNTLAGALFRRSETRRPITALLEVWLTILFAWGITPITLAFFWLRYLPRHELGGAYLEALLVSLSIALALWFYGLARSHFQSTTLPRRLAPLAAGLVALACTLTISYGAVHGIDPTAEARIATRAEEEDPGLAWIRLGVPTMLRAVGLSAFADLSEQDVSTKPPEWYQRSDEDLPRIVAGAQLGRSNLRYSIARGAFLVNAKLRRADMRGIDLLAANLQKADLREVKMQKAYLFFANLSDTEMRKADLRAAYLVNANLRGANMVEARLEGAALNNANLRDAVLSGAQMQRTTLAYADLQGARLFGANLVGADLALAKNLTQQQLEGACVDTSTSLPAKLKPPADACAFSLAVTPPAPTQSPATTIPAGRKLFTLTVVSSEDTCAGAIGGPTTPSPKELFRLNSGDTSGVRFDRAWVGRYWTFTNPPADAPAGTKVLNIPPGDGRSGFFKASFLLPEDAGDETLAGAANADDAGRVFLNGKPISAPILCATCADRVTQFGNAPFSATAHFLRGARNELVLSISNHGEGPSGGAFYALIKYTAPASHVPAPRTDEPTCPRRGSSW